VGGAGAKPQLGVSATADTTTIAFSTAVKDAAPAKVQILADPALPSVNLSAKPGAKIGTVAAKASATALGGAVLPLTGLLNVVAPTGTYLDNGAQVPIAKAAAACTGTATHTTFWVLSLTAAGQLLEVPVYVDAGKSGSPAKATITLCLPSPDIPPPKGAAFGAKVIEAVLITKGIFPTSNGEYRWRTLVTSYVAKSGNVNPKSTVETQALEHSPGAITLEAKRSGENADVSGNVTAAGKPVAGATVVVSGGRKAVRLKTAASGSYKGSVPLAPAGKVRATAIVPTKDLGASACKATFASQKIPCVDAVDSGFTVAAPAVKV
jgi:hypothetical protein